ncbi:hypothetical protein [Streptomyces wuyuanensis]|uniref:hypothetical protein n=1 Tax=Streptomyces wuyuanensis TaxID=1196353 RepID=UPI00342FFF40
MRYTITVRRWWTVLVALVVLLLLCWTVGASEVPVPSLIGGMAGARIAYFTPVLVVIAVMYSLDRHLSEAESTAVTPVHHLDKGAVVLTASLAHLAGLAVGTDVARNVTLLLALALLVRRFVNEATASAAGMLFLIVNLVAGRGLQPDGQATHSWWALALYPADSAVAWLLTVALFAVALLFSVSGGHAHRQSS